ncbi:DUF3868 domain-containing protein [Culturomica massiliensis]|uniref:DUF3868 domain-containing protein n=1 Tax=Culturomica massiliensis TaxID=1841857 RepID=UPI0008393FEB|nr:DUF3868 domain-containing protein [Culturomica massiliensis]
MKKTALISTLFLTVISVAPAFSQRSYQGEIRIVQNRFEQKGDTLFLQMNIDHSGIAVKPRQTIELTPVLEADSMDLVLPSVVLNGTNRDKVYQRSLKLDKQKSPAIAPYLVKRIDGRSNETISYDLTVPFEEWMAGATLNLYEDFCGCAGKRQLIAINMFPTALKLEKPIVPDTIIQPAPMPAPVIYTKEGSAFVNFPVSQSRILPGFRDNRSELAKIHTTLDELLSNQQARITAVELTGYASPEGPHAFNEKLSQRRAEALATYLKEQYQLPYSIYHISWGGEDWTGLYELVTASDMPEKQRIIDIIEQTGVNDTRIRQFRELDQGKSYRYMNEYYFPKLRRVDYKIYYQTEE